MCSRLCVSSPPNTHTHLEYTKGSLVQIGRKCLCSWEQSGGRHISCSLNRYLSILSAKIFTLYLCFCCFRPLLKLLKEIPSSINPSRNAKQVWTMNKDILTRKLVQVSTAMDHSSVEEFSVPQVTT